MFGRLDIALQVAVGIAWVALVALLIKPAPLLALGLFGAGLALGVLTFMVRRHARQVADRPQDDRSARLMVTQMLGQLVRIQLAYLKEDFQSTKQARGWLKRALPRSYGPALDDLVQDLEACRAGERPPAMSLVLRLRELGTKLNEVDQLLDRAAQKHQGHDIARPAAFVVTENVDESEENSEPQIFSIAGWIPARPALLPEVDRLTIMHDDNGKRRVLGQLDFADVARRLGKKLQRPSKEPIYRVDAVKAEMEALAPKKLPVGFVVGITDLV